MREGTAEPVQCLEHEAISPAASTPGSAGGPGDDRAPHGPSRSRDDAAPLPPPEAHRAGGASSGDPCHSTPVWPARMSGKPFLWAFRTRTPSDRMCCIHVGEFFGGCQDTLDRCREPLVCRAGYRGGTIAQDQGDYCVSTTDRENRCFIEPPR